MALTQNRAAEHPAALAQDVVYQSGISLVIAATKFDTFRDFEPEVKKVMSRALRFIAHTHGAFLTYLSGLHSGSDASGQVRGSG